MHFKHSALLLLLSNLSYGHFILQVPQSIGYASEAEDKAPCGGFDITTRQPLIEWPIDGHPVQLLSTHSKSTWMFHAALLTNTSAVRMLVPMIEQNGVGTFCEPSVPGVKGWEGKDAVVQIVQRATDGALYQCAAVKFVSKPAIAAPTTCKNSTGVEAKFMSGMGMTVSSTNSSSTEPSQSSGHGEHAPAPTAAKGAGLMLYPNLVTLAIFGASALFMR